MILFNLEQCAAVAFLDQGKLSIGQSEITGSAAQGHDNSREFEIIVEILITVINECASYF